MAQIVKSLGKLYTRPHLAEVMFYVIDISLSQSEMYLQRRDALQT